MAYQIIKRPDGKFALWSSIVDNFVVERATRKQVVAFFMQEAADEAKRKTAEVFKRIDAGQPPYFQFTLTYAEACAIRDQVHRKKGTT